jgi:hypothetical protein
MKKIILVFIYFIFNYPAFSAPRTTPKFCENLVPQIATMILYNKVNSQFQEHVEKFVSLKSMPDYLTIKNKFHCPTITWPMKTKDILNQCLEYNEGPAQRKTFCNEVPSCDKDLNLLTTEQMIFNSFDLNSLEPKDQVEFTKRFETFAPQVYRSSSSNTACQLILDHLDDLIHKKYHAIVVVHRN